jgi:homocysteine S-methyltransferase
MIHPDLLRRVPLIADGPPGPWLKAVHPGAGPPEALNLRHPEHVQAAHEAYFRAGARVLRANTAAANALALAACGLADRCEAVNNAGVALLRAAVGAQGVVAGSVRALPPGTPLPDRERAYGQQLVYQMDTGVDFIWLEGGSSVEELLLWRRLAANAGDAPVLALLRIEPGGAVLGGLEPGLAARRLADGGLDALGLVSAPGQAVDAALDALLGAGLPLAALLEPGTLPPADFAAALAPLAGRGVAILGGGAGAGPDHIRALAERAGAPSTAPGS